MKKVLPCLLVLAVLAPAVCRAQASDPAPGRILDLMLNDVPLSVAMERALADGPVPVVEGGDHSGEPVVSLWVRHVPADRYLRVLTAATEIQGPGKGAGNLGRPPVERVLSLEDLKGFERLIVDGRNLLAEAWGRAEEGLPGGDGETASFYGHRRALAEQTSPTPSLGGRGFLGVHLAGKSYKNADSLDPSVRQALESWDGWGAFLRGIIPGTPAEVSGLMAGDVVIRINEFWVDSPCTLMKLIARTEPGKEVQLEVLRDGQVVTLWAYTTDRESVKGTAHN